MAFKLALSAGHYLYTAGKRCLKSIEPNETREWWLNDRVADRIQVLLSEYDGIQVLRLDDTTGQKYATLRERSNASDRFGADFYLAVHHNAGINGGSGGGIQAYVYNGRVSSASLAWQKDLYNELIKITGLKGNRSNGIPRANLHECREPKAPSVLLELGFMDSTTDVPIILTQEFAYKCAQACVNVIVKRAGLTKKSGGSSSSNSSSVPPTQSSSAVGTYNLVTSVNKYANAGDAKARKNSKGTYKAGTYYIYTGRPNGFEGMYNITSDKTGRVPGAWINPAENVIAGSADKHVQKLYRVRLSWSDAKSQKGAFMNLTNAKACCDKAGAGHSVYDWDGKVVYSYVAPKPVTPAPQPKPTPKPVAPKKVYELDFPEKHQIVEYDLVSTEGINEEECTRAIVAIKKNNPDFDIEIAKAFFLLADEYYHINPMRAIAQSILETGWFKFAGSSVRATQHNYCGLGAVGGGASGAAFDTIENGVRAQLQHLYAYGCKEPLAKDESTVVDPRFKYVTRGCAIYWEQLAGRWAVPGFEGATPEEAMANGSTYGQKINAIYESLMKTKVTKTDIKKYFTYDEPGEPLPESDKEVENTTPDVDSTDDKKVNSIIEMIVKVFKKLAEIFMRGFKHKGE